MYQHLYCYLLLLIYFFVGINPVEAQVKTWDDGGDGISWSDPANWNLDVLPAATDDVVLLSSDSILLGSSVAIASLEIIDISILVIDSMHTLTIDGSQSTLAKDGVLITGAGSLLDIEATAFLVNNNPMLNGIRLSAGGELSSQGDISIDNVTANHGLLCEGANTLFYSDGTVTISNVTGASSVLNSNGARLEGKGGLDCDSFFNGDGIGNQAVFDPDSPYNGPAFYPISGDATFTSTSAINIQNTGLSPTAGISYSQVQIDGDLSLDGILNFTSLYNDVAEGTQMVIMTYTGSMTGTFSDVHLPPGFGDYKVDYGIMVPGQIILFDDCISPIPFTNNWTGDGDGSSWEDGDNWSLDHEPRICESVIIGFTSPFNPSIFVSSQNAEMAFLYLYRGQLTINSGAHLQVYFDAYEFGGDGFSSNKAISLFESATLTNNGDISIHDAIEGINIGTDFAGGLQVACHFINNGNLELEYSGAFGLNASKRGQFLNAGSILINSNSVENGSTGLSIRSNLELPAENSGNITIMNMANNFARGININNSIFSNTSTGNIQILNIKDETTGIFTLGYSVFSNEGIININHTGTGTSIRHVGNKFTNLMSGSISCSNDIWNYKDFANNGNINVQGVNNKFLNFEFYSGTGTFSGSAFINSKSGSDFGELSPGDSIGTTSIIGEMICSPSSSQIKSNIIFEIAGNSGAGVPNGHDQIVVDGDVTLSGKIVVNILNGFIPSASDTFTVLTYTGSLIGDFILQDFDNAMPSFEVDLTAPGEVRLISNCSHGNNNWTGAGGDNLWENAANWSLGIPNVCHDVIIVGATVTMPVSAGVNATCASLKLFNSAHLTIEQTNTLEIDGALAMTNIGLHVEGGAVITNSGTLNVYRAKGTGVYVEESQITNYSIMRIHEFNVGGFSQREGLELTEMSTFFNGQLLSIEVYESYNYLTGMNVNVDCIFTNDGTTILYGIKGPGSEGINVNDASTIHNVSGKFEFRGMDGNVGLLIGYGGEVVNNAEIKTGINSHADLYISGGILSGSGTITLDSFINNIGLIEPGNSPGLITYTGVMNFKSNGSVNLEVAGNSGAGNPGGHDQVQVTGDLDLGGIINVNALGGFTPALTDTFTLIAYTGTLSGSFTIVNIDPVFTDWVIDSTSIPGELVLVYGCAASNDWLGLGDGQTWEDPANWSRAYVPLSCESVFISSDTLSINSFAAVADLELNNEVVLTITSGNSLIINGAYSDISKTGLWIDDSEVINFGTINIANSTHNALRLVNGDLQNNGSISIAHSVLYKGMLVEDLSQVTNNSMITIDSGVIDPTALESIIIRSNCQFFNSGSLQLE